MTIISGVLHKCDSEVCREVFKNSNLDTTLERLMKLSEDLEKKGCFRLRIWISCFDRDLKLIFAEKKTVLGRLIMDIHGYSERGIIDALFYSMQFQNTSSMLRLTKELLNEIRMPFDKLGNLQREIASADDIEIFIENTLSEFGDPDILIFLKERGRHLACLFIEAKVSTGKGVVLPEIMKFASGIQVPNIKGSSRLTSNLFSQLALKFLLFNRMIGNRVSNGNMGPMQALYLEKGYRSIGQNNIATDLYRKIAQCYSAHYIAILPDRDLGTIDSCYRGYVEPCLTSMLGITSAADWGYINWESIESFCLANSLQHCMQMFLYNKGHIY